MIYDFGIVGGGIVGLATARALIQKHPGAGIVLFEKESDFAAHQSGHNSGVIHAGIYYAPGSLKAQLCREGLRSTIGFCREHDISYEQCGKLIVATNQTEEARLSELYERAVANGVVIKALSAGELREVEPCITGTAALLSPDTAIVDYRAVCAALARSLALDGVQFAMKAEVQSIEELPDRVSVSAKGSTWQCRRLVVCGGLQADRLASLAGLKPDFRIVPFRGEYFELPATRKDLISHLIYPAPDPALPFLGVHLTRMIDGGITVGPNAILGFAREGYAKFSVSLADTASFAGFPGFWKLIWKNRRHAIHEFHRSVSRRAYLQECRKYCPDLTLADLLPYRAGIRAQAVKADGTAVHDFLFVATDRMLHVCNAPSPAATSAFPIGRMIAEQLR